MKQVMASLQKLFMLSQEQINSYHMEKRFLAKREARGISINGWNRF